jgi:hypothetical protein
VKSKQSPPVNITISAAFKRVKTAGSYSLLPVSQYKERLYSLHLNKKKHIQDQFLLEYLMP